MKIESLDEHRVLNILLDQNIPRNIKKWLGEVKPEWRVSHTTELKLEIASDLELISWAVNHAAVIITFDEDFADKRNLNNLAEIGIIRIKTWPTTSTEIKTALSRVFEVLPDKEIFGFLTIVDKAKIRSIRL